MNEEMEEQQAEEQVQESQDSGESEGSQENSPTEMMEEGASVEGVSEQGDAGSEDEGVSGGSEESPENSPGEMEEEGASVESVSDQIDTGTEDGVVDGESLERILKIRLPVEVVIARRSMPLRSILELGHGAIIEFDKPYTSDITLEVNSEIIGKGEAVVVHEKYGLRIKEIGSLKETIEKIGGF